MELAALGFCEWFEARCLEDKSGDYCWARVVAVNKGNYLIRNEEVEILAEIAGKISFKAESNLDYPVVGDWVGVKYVAGESFAVIHEILPRKSFLTRKTSGKTIEYQAIAANLDYAYILQSNDANFNLRRLERYLSMVNESDIDPVILLSKSDLVSDEELEQNIAAVVGMNYGYPVLAFSNTSGVGLDGIRSLIEKGKTYCLIGSSGVGKTTLLNSLIGEDVFATFEVREKDSRGRHVTTRRQLTVLEEGGLIIDTPGMRELGNIGIEVGIGETFSDIIEMSRACKFSDCTHVIEPGCSVLEAVANGELDEGRYANYVKLCKESAHNEMSMVEKRRKDKKFGKMCKGVMKEKKRRRRDG